MRSKDERTQAILKGAVRQPQQITQIDEEYYGQALRHAENVIGAVRIPVGVVGPLQVNGEHTHDAFVVPLATTEGCLIASVNRGCKAITLSGGADVTAKKVGITRAPVFHVDSAEQAKEAAAWVTANMKRLQEKTKETSSHLTLLSVTPVYKDGYFFIHFTFDAQDAMGMNMATNACEYLIRTLIEPETKLRCIALSGNMCGDKKPSTIHITAGRGFSAQAEVRISPSIVTEVLKTSVEKIHEVYQSKLVVGSALAGSLGSNAHHANIIAAVYIATGQDPAHTVEGSLGSTTVDITSTGDLYMKVSVPAIVCGIVGGGTELPEQREALQLMGLEADKSRPGIVNHIFAEIIAATVLAGELSLMAALASSDLALAHNTKRKR